MDILDIVDKTWDLSNIRSAKTHRGIAWVNWNTKIAFLGIPKCGNSSIRYQIGDLDTINIEDVPEDFYMFTIIRNPIKRIISAYIEVIQDCEDYPGGRYKYDLGISHDKVFFFDDLLRNPDRCERFIIYLDKLVEWGFFEPHCISQVIYLTDGSGAAFSGVQVFGLDDLSFLESYLGFEFVKMNQSENYGYAQELDELIQNVRDVRDKIEGLYGYDMMVFEKFKQAILESVRG